jgi:hypothetical protein
VFPGSTKSTFSDFLIRLKWVSFNQGILFFYQRTWPPAGAWLD